MPLAPQFLDAVARGARVLMIGQCLISYRYAVVTESIERFAQLSLIYVTIGRQHYRESLCLHT